MLPRLLPPRLRLLHTIAHQPGGGFRHRSPPPASHSSRCPPSEPAPRCPPRRPPSASDSPLASALPPPHRPRQPETAGGRCCTWGAWKPTARRPKHGHGRRWAPDVLCCFFVEGARGVGEQALEGRCRGGGLRRSFSISRDKVGTRLCSSSLHEQHTSLGHTARSAAFLSTAPARTYLALPTRGIAVGRAARGRSGSGRLLVPDLLLPDRFRTRDALHRQLRSSLVFRFLVPRFFSVCQGNKRERSSGRRIVSVPYFVCNCLFELVSYRRCAGLQGRGGGGGGVGSQ